MFLFSLDSFVNRDDGDLGRELESGDREQWRKTEHESRRVSTGKFQVESI